MKTYMQFLTEMAINIGSPFSVLEQYPSERKKRYTSYLSLYGKEPVGIKSYVCENPSDMHIITVDHTSKELIHHAVVEHRATSHEFPYAHIVQMQVDRVKSADRIPREHATNMIYQVWNNQPLPLRSSSEQYKTGHGMWKRLVKKALDAGKHVSFWDGNNLHSVSHANQDEFLKRSFGDYADSSTEHHHLMISHKALI